MSDLTRTSAWMNKQNSFNMAILIEKFEKILNVKSIKDFNKACKEKHLEIKNQYKIEGDTSKLNRTNFIAIMKNIFYNKTINPTEMDFEPVFDLLFKRFKIVKYDIKSENVKFEGINKLMSDREREVFYVNDIIPEEREIDVFEIAIALSIYIKCDFKEKIRLLFDVTDVDEDGYINENEIRYMISTVNFIFADEESLIGSNSSIVNQSLASIKSQQPGDLSKIITTEKYVHFDQFYASIKKIVDLKYSIIPIFVDMKSSLYKQKIEPEYEIEKRNLNEFLSIANEIVSNVKVGNNEFIKQNQDMKRIIEQSKLDKEKKIRKKIIANNHKNNLNNHIINSNINIINSLNEVQQNLEYVGNSSANGYSSNNANKENSSNKKDMKLSITLNKRFPNLNNNGNDFEDNISSVKKGFTTILNRNFISTVYDGNKINLNKIANLEAQPGRIKVKDNTKDYPSMKTDNTNTQDTMNKFDGSNNHNNILMRDYQKKLNKGNMSLTEIMQEIRAIANKHNSDDHDSEEILKKFREIKDMSDSLKHRLTSNIKTNFSLFDYKPPKHDH